MIEMRFAVYSRIPEMPRPSTSFLKRSPILLRKAALLVGLVFRKINLPEIRTPPRLSRSNSPSSEIVFHHYVSLREKISAITLQFRNSLYQDCPDLSSSTAQLLNQTQTPETISTLPRKQLSPSSPRFANAIVTHHPRVER